MQMSTLKGKIPYNIFLICKIHETLKSPKDFVSVMSLLCLCYAL